MDIGMQDKTEGASGPLTRADVKGLLRKVGSTDKLNLSNQNLIDIDLGDFDLTGANLSEANLTGANLGGANLTGANLTRANLTRANLTRTNLTGTQFNGTVLVGIQLSGDLLDWAKINRISLNDVNLSKANLSEADLREVGLSGTNLSGTNLSGTNLSGANLSETNLIRANLSDATLIRVNLRWANLSGATLRRANLRWADLRWADLRWADLSEVILRRADLSKANLSGADLSGADLSETNLSDLNLSRANLSRADLSKANLSGVNLSGADLNGAILYGANLSRIKLLWFKLKGAKLNQVDPLPNQSEAYTFGEEKVPPPSRIARDLDGTRDGTFSNTKAPNLSSSGIVSRIYALLIALHPARWTKSLLVFVGLVFAQRPFTVSSFERIILTFVVFCLASSCIYLLNDLFDLEKDREHPVKRKRPLASGRLPISWAIVTMGILVLLCALLTFLIFTIPINPLPDIFASIGGANVLFMLALISFLLLTVLYTIRLKHVVLLDVFITAGSAVLRILAGTVVVPISISPWLYLLTILLILFFGLGKRRHELGLLQEQAARQRQILREYSIPMLDHMITILIAATLTVYSLYTFQGIAGNQYLLVTIPLVLYSMFRYLYLVYMRMESGIPEEILLRDPHMLITVVLCTTIIILALHVLP